MPLPPPITPPVAREAEPIAPPSPAAGMRWIPGGTFDMGSDQHYPEEGPVQRVLVDGFWMGAHPVTNEEFRRFVEETGYVSLAERDPDPAAYPSIDPAALVPGSLVFTPPRRQVPLHDPRAWWTYVAGACWRQPEGPGSSLRGRERHPVVHVAYEDAEAYSAWAGKGIPTEAEWEFAARGGLHGAEFTWGNVENPDGRHMANTWQGRFPWQNLALDGYAGTSPVGSFPPNAYELFDVAGNVWEWTSDFYRPRHAPRHGQSCCTPRNPRVATPDERDARGRPDAAIPRKVVKGGSHLCARSYCFRYRPSARQGEAVDTSTGHIGFRCIVRPFGARGG